MERAPRARRALHARIVEVIERSTPIAWRACRAAGAATARGAEVLRRPCREARRAIRQPGGRELPPYRPSASWRICPRAPDTERRTSGSDLQAPPQQPWGDRAAAGLPPRSRAPPSVGGSASDGSGTSLVHWRSVGGAGTLGGTVEYSQLRPVSDLGGVQCAGRIISPRLIAAFKRNIDGLGGRPPGAPSASGMPGLPAVMESSVDWSLRPTRGVSRSDARRGRAAEAADDRLGLALS